MMSLLAPLWRYADWLHLRWPAGKPEKLPAVRDGGSTNVPGVWVAGDLTGIPLLKFSLQTGADCIRRIQASARRARSEDDWDVVILGAGVAGMSAAAEAQRLGLRALVIESSQSFNTIANFPIAKPIYTYPQEMEPESRLTVSATVKEPLLTELREQVANLDIQPRIATAERISRQGERLLVHLKDADPVACAAVVIAIGRGGNYRRLGIPGEDHDKVSNRLHDPAAYRGKPTLIVGGGDSACEVAISIAQGNAATEQPLVTLAYRGAELSRAKPENIRAVHALAAAGRLRLALGTEPTAIDADSVTLQRRGGAAEALPNEAVLSLIGREAPLDFFRRSGIRIHGERSPLAWLALAAFLLFAIVLYGMKAGVGPMAALNGTAVDPATWVAALTGAAGDRRTLWGTVVASATGHVSFWVTVLYSSAVVAFGIDRIRRRRTPYVRVQTMTLAAIQVLPLFILPEIILPWMGANDWIPHALREGLFPGDSWWRAYGFILAWPLMVWNVFTSEPLLWWLVIAFVQTFVLIPLLVWRWGKGAYCGWICSCGALAETMGDRHREKMPHGPFWNRLNFVGQALLGIAGVILGLHIIAWTTGWGMGLVGLSTGWFWKPIVDFLLAGALGVGLYFAYSGRVWCRFACPLAALMHIYARFSQFRITVNQKKCISCNACTSVCHQGIDIMAFANRGQHMQDPECVRCSACVQACPTGVLQFGRVDGQERVVAVDGLWASPVIAKEGQDERIGKTGTGQVASPVSF